MSEIMNNYDILDVFDENQYQTVLMAIDKTHLQDIVIINKIKSKDLLDDEFLSDYQGISNNIVDINTDDDHVTIINKYEQSHLLSDYLTETLPTFGIRLDLAKQYLHSICHYENFSNPMKLVLIDEDQLTVKKDSLIFSNYLFLKEYQEDATLSDVHKCIGKTLETILQLHRETLNSRLTQLQSVIYKLNKSSLDWPLKEVNRQYLEAITNIAAEPETKKEDIIEKVVEARIMSEPTLVEDEITEEAIALHQEEETITLSDLIVEEAIEPDPVIKYTIESEPAFEETEETESVIKYTIEPESIIEDPAELEPIIKEIIETEPVVEETVEPELVVEETIEAELVVEDIVEPEPVAEKMVEPETIVEEAIEPEPIVEEMVKPETVVEEAIEPEPIVKEMVEPETVVEESIETEPIVEEMVEPETVVEEIMEPETSIIESVSKVESSHEKVILSNEPSENAIEEILSRNNKQHSDMYINQKKKAQRFVPTFLLFFIVLIIITSLLIFYSSTYM